MPGQSNPNGELYEGRYIIGIVRKGRIKWLQNGAWITPEYDKLKEDINNAYKECKDLLLDNKDPYANLKLSANVFPEAKGLTARGKEIKNIPFPQTTNQVYGRLPWYKDATYQKYRFP